MTDNVCCLVKIIQKDERIFAAVQFEIKLFDFFYQSKRLIDYIYRDIYCKLSKCIAQTPCSYEHYLVTVVTLVNRGTCVNNLPKVVAWQCFGLESNLQPQGYKFGMLLLHHKTIRSFATFKSFLKSHLFTSAYDI